MGVPLEGPDSVFIPALDSAGVKQVHPEETEPDTYYFEGDFYGIKSTMMITVNEKTKLLSDAVVTCGPYRTRDLYDRNQKYLLGKLQREWGNFKAKGDGSLYMLNNYGYIRQSTGLDEEGRHTIRYYYLNTSPYYKDASNMGLKGFVQEVITENPVTENDIEHFSETGLLANDDVIDREYDVTPVGRTGEHKSEICIMDDGGNVLPDGETGNLCYRAPYFRGYIGLPELTEQVRLNGYIRSGDRGSIQADGSIVIIGRADEMIKIRGNRIEPAEIESVFRELLEVDWVGVRGIFDQGHPYLCAYYAQEPKRSVEEAERLAAGRLPSYMIPACFMKVDSIPREANGKIAKRKLPVPDRDGGKR